MDPRAWAMLLGVLGLIAALHIAKVISGGEALVKRRISPAATIRTHLSDDDSGFHVRRAAQNSLGEKVTMANAHGEGGVLRFLNEEGSMSESDRRYLRYAIMIAERAREHGSLPFGAILVSSRGWILSEGENTQGATADCTCHAETNLLHEATRRFSRNLLAHSTMYTSAEPCPMCTGAIFWSGVGRIVFGLSSERLYALTQDKAEHLFEHCADLLARGTHRVEVCGPMLEDEAESVFRTTTTLTNAPYAYRESLLDCEYY